MGAALILLLIALIPATAASDEGGRRIVDDTDEQPPSVDCRFYDIISVTARRYGVEAPLVMAIIQAESRYNPRAESSKGARGLMQLMPETAAAWGVNDSFDPVQNIEGGVRYLKWLLQYFDGDRHLALAAYNAGLKNVLRHDGVPPFPATRAYLRQVWRWYERYKRNAPLGSRSATLSQN